MVVDELAGDDLRLDLLRALADVDDLHVPVQLLDHLVGAVAVLSLDVVRGDYRLEDHLRRVVLVVDRRPRGQPVEIWRRNACSTIAAKHMPIKGIKKYENGLHDEISDDGG